MPDRTKSRVLYISYDGMTDPLGQSQVIPYIIELAKAGYQFTLMSFEKPDRMLKDGEDIRQLLTKNGIEWAPVSYTPYSSVLSPLYNLVKMRGKALELHRQNNYAIVHCRSYLPAIVGLTMKRKFGLKFLFDMRGFWADERVDGGLWNLNNPLFNFIYRFLKRKERELLSEADYVVSLTDAGRREIHSWKDMKNQPVPIEVIPCCADLNFFSRDNVKQDELVLLRQQLKLTEDEFVLSYSGSIGTWYMLHEMLDFFKCLLERKPSAKFLFITHTPVQEILKQALTRGIAEQNIVITAVPRDKMPMYLALSSWSIFFIKPAYSKKASSPTKQGEIMGMGIPHICNAGVGDVEDIVEQGITGLTVKAFTADDYRSLIDKMLMSSPISPEKIRLAAQKYYSLNAGAALFKGIYQKIGGNW